LHLRLLMLRLLGICQASYIKVVRNLPLTGVNRVPIGKHRSQPKRTSIFDH
jgi:hypothetical protein